VAAFSISASLGWSLLHSQLLIVVAVHPKRRSLLTSGFQTLFGEKTLDFCGAKLEVEKKRQEHEDHG